MCSLFTFTILLTQPLVSFPYSCFLIKPIMVHMKYLAQL